MTKIKLNNVEVDKSELVKLYKEKPELFKEEEKPLGDDFSMLEYFQELRASIDAPLDPKTYKRLNALIKIWEWKEKNDGDFGVEEVMEDDTLKSSIYYELDDKEFKIDSCYTDVAQTELPYFSTGEIADRAIKELEQEYKVVFNVK